MEKQNLKKFNKMLSKLSEILIQKKESPELIGVYLNKPLYVFIEDVMIPLNLQWKEPDKVPGIVKAWDEVCENLQDTSFVGEGLCVDYGLDFNQLERQMQARGYDLCDCCGFWREMKGFHYSGQSSVLGYLCENCYLAQKENE